MPDKITLHLQRKPDVIDITIITPSGISRFVKLLITAVPSIALKC